MKINKISGYIINIHINFDISSMKILFSKHILIFLNYQGITGMGEGILYKNNIIKSQQILNNRIFPYLKNNEFENIQSIQYDLFKNFSKRYPSIIYALDVALWDLLGKIKNKSVRYLLGTPYRDEIEITEQTFIKSEKKINEKINQIINRGTNSIKIKIGRSIKKDKLIIKNIRRQVGKDFKLRVDINQGYKISQLKEMIPYFNRYEIDVIEEPTRKSDWNELRRIKNQNDFKIMLDESIHTISDLNEVIEKELIDILNLKLTRVGGLTSALKFIKFCEKNKVKLSVGCSEELGIGMLSILNISSIIKNLFSTEGIGPIRLGFDITQNNFKLRNGAVKLPNNSGLGVDFSIKKFHNISKRINVYNVQKPSLNMKINEIYNIYKNRLYNLLILLKKKIIE